MNKPNLFDVLFGNANIEDIEDPSQVYEVYDTVTELVEKRGCKHLSSEGWFPTVSKTLH